MRAFIIFALIACVSFFIKLTVIFFTKVLILFHRLTPITSSAPDTIQTPIEIFAQKNCIFLKIPQHTTSNGNSKMTPQLPICTAFSSTWICMMTPMDSISLISKLKSEDIMMKSRAVLTQATMMITTKKYSRDSNASPRAT